MMPPVVPLRLFLDAGVVIEGLFSPWGASKAVLILATSRANVTIVLAHDVEEDIRDAVTSKLAPLAPDAARLARASVDGWFSRVVIERLPLPDKDQVRARFGDLMPVIHHQNDLPAVIAAINARPDWVLSTNTRHWNDALARDTGLRVATPLAFLRQIPLRP